MHYAQSSPRPGGRGEAQERDKKQVESGAQGKSSSSNSSASEGTRPLRISYFSEPTSFEFEAPEAYWRAIANAEYSCSFGNGLVPVLGLIVCQG